MPHILSPLIKTSNSQMWMEGAPYSKETIYKADLEAVPPVNYEAHTLKPHSLTHIESPKHIDNQGKRVEDYFEGNYFFGMCTVIRLKGNHYKKINEDTYLWEVTVDELKQHLNNIVPKKLLITVDEYKVNQDGFHDPNYVLVLSQQAADWLISNEEFNLYGTSWKSTDYNPGKAERPIHKTIFSKAIILECLDLKDVPEGEYFLNCYPLRLENSSESPVTPILFTKEEILTEL